MCFMADLIAIKILVNITIYLRDDVVHVKIVMATALMATALMAIARKIIILNEDEIEPSYLWGLASIVYAMSIGYWLVVEEHPTQALAVLRSATIVTLLFTPYFVAVAPWVGARCEAILLRWRFSTGISEGAVRAFWTARTRRIQR